MSRKNCSYLINKPLLHAFFKWTLHEIAGLKLCRFLSHAYFELEASLNIVALSRHKCLKYQMRLKVFYFTERHTETSNITGPIGKKASTVLNTSVS